jgi:hypothetical protein
MIPLISFANHRAWLFTILIGCGASGALGTGCGGASDDYEAPQLPAPPPPPPAPTVESAPLPEPYTQATPDVPTSPSSAPPPAPPQGTASPAAPPPPVAPGTSDPGQLVYSYPTGQWVYMAGQGWVWIPASAQTRDVEGTPYVYLYTPAYGWTWYVSPWGVGPYRYGLWVRHPWHPVGLHGYWVARPYVGARLGRGRR